MTTETYDKKPKFDPNKPFEAVDEKPAFDPDKPFEAVDEPSKKKVGSVAFPELESETPSTSKDDGNGLFAYRNLFKDPEAEKHQFIKRLPVPKTVESGVKKDKKQDQGAFGYIYNTVVDGVGEIFGGLSSATNAIVDAGTDLIDKAQGTPGLSKSMKESPTVFNTMTLPKGENVINDMQQTFHVGTSYKPPEFDVTNGIQASDVKSMAVQAPRQLLDMVYGAYTFGGSFFMQSVGQNAKELSKIPEADKLTPVERLGYLYTQGVVQAALEKLALNKILKSTNLSAKATEKITNEIIDEFSKKGVKATAKQIEDAAIKKVSSMTAKMKNVGVKAGTSFVVEGTTEGAQTAASEGGKIALNKISGKKIFDEEDITTNFVKNVINSSVQGGAFGGVVGGGVGVLQNTNKAIRNKVAEAQTPEDFQKIQADLAYQVELGNITQEEAEAANITAQQYAEIASKIPTELDSEKKYALIGGIEQREQLKAAIEETNAEIGYLDEAFHEEPLAKMELLNAKLEQTNDYIDGLVADKKVTYKKDGDGYFKTTPKGEVVPITKEHYDLGVAVREEEAAKNKKPEINPQDQKSFRFNHDEDVPQELEGVKPIHIQEINTAEGPKVEATYSGEQLIKAGLAKKGDAISEVKAAKILAKVDFPDTMVAMAEQDPLGTLKFIAEQAQGGRTEDMKSMNIPEEVINEAIKLYPATPQAQASEGAAENVVPSTLKDESLSKNSESSSKQGLSSSKSTFKELKEQADNAKNEGEFIRDIITDYDVRYKMRKAAQPLVKELPIVEVDKIKPTQKIEQDVVDNWQERVEKGEKPFIIVRDDGTIDGHHKLQAYKNLGWKDVPVLYEKDLKDFYQSTKTEQQTKPIEAEADQTESAGGDIVPPALPPTAEEMKTEEDTGGKKKSLANRLVNAEKVPEAAKAGIKDKGLIYEPQSQEEAQRLADAILDEVGIDDAVLRARAQEFGGDVNTLVQTQALNRLAELSDKETDPSKKLEYDQKFAEVGIQLDEWVRKQGRGISALNFFYKKSPLGMQMIENARRKQDFDEWSKPKDKSWKEFFDEMMKEPEFETLVKEEVKKERAEERKERKDKVHKAIDDAAAKWAKKVKPKSDPGEGTQKQGVSTDEIFKAAATAIKAAYDAGEAVAKIVQDAIDYISEKLGHDQWGTEEFRKEWEEKLRDKSVKKKLTDEEIKARVLDKFRKKLKGLSDDQKEEVVRKSFQQIVENGGLDYDEFKKIIADITGRSEMTQEEADKLKELVKTLNSVEDAATKARNDRTKQSLNDFRKQQLSAGKASKELSRLLYNKPNIIKRLTSIMQLNTLGIPALVNNPIYNIWNQTTLRFPIGVVNTLIDGGISGIAKLMGKNYTSETSLISLDKYWLRTQKEFFKKLGLGLKEAGTQFFTGLDRQDYTQKELHGQQIRPLSSIMDLLSKSKRQKMTAAEKADKVIQGSPQGWIAEAIARVLNLGDKPQRFAAEGAQAAAFSKALGISDIDYELFIEFPREEAYRQYKAKGLSDEEAGKKADYVRDTIVKEGQRSTFQQDNLLNDVLNKVFGGEGSGLGSLTKAVTISPYIKIPSNAFWSYFNLVNPEVAVLQAAYYGTKAAARQKDPTIKFPADKPTATAAKDYHEARYWLAHAAVGIAVRSVVTSMVLAGVFRSSNDDDETKKEREGERYYEPQGGINANKLAAWLRGDDPTQVKGGLVISNRWWGHWGSVGNTIAKRYENLTPEQKANQDDYWSMLAGNLQLSSIKELQQGVFSNSSSLLSALENPEYGMKRWGNSTINMFTNIIQPAAIAQLSRAEVPYVSQTKADTFGQELKNSMLQRSSWLRKLTGQYPPAKVSIWGERIDRTKDNFAQRLFGWNSVDKDAFARPIYDDVVRTNDIGYFPPATKPEINGMKLNTEETMQLETYIGQARKGYIAPFVNDQATIDGFDVKYSQLNDDDKKYVLQYLYGLAKQDGEERFLTQYPAKAKPEKEIDYNKEIQQEVFRLLQKYKN
jgi:hypothetical protein